MKKGLVATGEEKFFLNAEVQYLRGLSAEATDKLPDDKEINAILRETLREIFSYKNLADNHDYVAEDLQSAIQAIQSAVRNFASSIPRSDDRRILLTETDMQERLRDLESELGDIQDKFNLSTFPGN